MQYWFRCNRPSWSAGYGSERSRPGLPHEAGEGSSEADAANGLRTIQHEARMLVQLLQMMCNASLFLVRAPPAASCRAVAWKVLEGVIAVGEEPERSFEGHSKHRVAGHWPVPGGKRQRAFWRRRIIVDQGPARCRQLPNAAWRPLLLCIQNSGQR